jgi:hypothetical protein
MTGEARTRSSGCGPSWIDSASDAKRVALHTEHAWRRHGHSAVRAQALPSLKRLPTTVTELMS